MSHSEPLLTPAEVARLFRVDTKTVARWAKSGKLPFTETPGGMRRYHKTDVEKVFTDSLVLSNNSALSNSAQSARIHFLIIEIDSVDKKLKVKDLKSRIRKELQTRRAELQAELAELRGDNNG